MRHGGTSVLKRVITPNGFFIIIGQLLKKNFFTWGGDWKTPTNLYRNLGAKNKTINFQMHADRFSFGYKEHVIGIYNLGPFIGWTTDIDTVNIGTLKWKKVDLKINQMHFAKEEQYLCCLIHS